MSNNSAPNLDKYQGYLNRLILLGIIVLFVVQLIAFMRLLFFREDVWTAGEYMVDKFGHVSQGTIIFSSVVLLLLLILVEFWRKHKLVMLACIFLWLRTAVGGGAWRYYMQTYSNVGQNLPVFDQTPWLMAVVGSSGLGCLATLALLGAVIQGDTLQALVDDWTGSLLRKLTKAR